MIFEYSKGIPMSFRRWLFVTLLLAVASCLLVSTHVFAQETTGGLQGTVKDPSGALSGWR